MSGCLGVWVSGCLGVWVSGCLGVWVSGCLGVWVSGCLGVWVSGCLGVWVSGWDPSFRSFFLQGTSIEVPCETRDMESLDNVWLVKDTDLGSHF